MAEVMESTLHDVKNSAERRARSHARARETLPTEEPSE